MQIRTESGRSLILAATIATNKGEQDEAVGLINRVENDIDLTLIEIGARLDHDRWWSPYWRIGGGIAKSRLKFTQADTTGPSSSRFDYPFYVLSGALGGDAHFVPGFLKSLGFYASAEVGLAQSLFRGGRINVSPGLTTSVAPPEPWRLTNVNAGFSLGFEMSF